MKLSLVASAISAGLLLSATVSANTDTQAVVEQEQQIERIEYSSRKLKSQPLLLLGRGGLRPPT